MNIFRLFTLKNVVLYSIIYGYNFDYFKGWCNMTRKQAREEAFILIFEKEFNDDALQDILTLAEEVRDIKADDYVKNVFFGVFENIHTIDEKISQNAVGWSINRITKTALAILRLAIYEIEFYDEIPVSVSINEAVELAKKYATKEDASFINGILSTIAKSQENA